MERLKIYKENNKISKVNFIIVSENREYTESI